MPIKSFLARRGARRGISRRKGKTHITSRVVIRKPVSWRMRVIWGTLIAIAVGMAGAGLFVTGQYSAGYASIDSAFRLRNLETDNGQLRARAAELSDLLASTTTQLRIEQGARNSMAGQIAKLENERNRLTRDLALFENLFPSNGEDGRPTIRGFQVEPATPSGSPGAWRYRLLIMRPGRTQDTFTGEIQLQVRYRQDGREMLAASQETGKVSDRLQFERYQRIEGHFQLPAGAKLLGATARVVENGRPVAESVFQP